MIKWLNMITYTLLLIATIALIATLRHINVTLDAVNLCVIT